jgi:hypothetical protein
MITTEHTDNSDTRLSNTAHTLSAGEPLPPFGHSWPCSNCGTVNEGYPTLCEQCGEC